MADNSDLTIVDPEQNLSWQDFEDEVASYFEQSIPTGEWGVNASCCRVRRKPRYFSRDREADIVFDVAVEVFPNDDPAALHLLWLIECKNYPSRNVKVDEVEEFHRKMMQVGAHKGAIFTRCGFDEGTVRFARANRIGLYVLRKRELIVCLRSANGGDFGDTQIMIQSVGYPCDGNLRELNSLISDCLCPAGIEPLRSSLGMRRVLMGLDMENIENIKEFYYVVD
jgi:Restriction endonuclease